MTKLRNKPVARRAFTLVEVLAALTIAALTLIALLTIYARATTAATAITNRLGEKMLEQEILQRIAEDVDRFGLSKMNTSMAIQNKLEKGHQVAQLVMESRLYADVKQRRATFEKVVWQSSYEPEIDSFVLYRAHSGINYEDSLLEAQKTEAERELFVPFCSGITYFRIEVLQGRRVLNRWSGSSGQLPAAIVVTISFAESFKAPTGGFDVPDEEKITRTIAIDRTRKITFIAPKIPEEAPEIPEEAPENGS
jgi:prepilin-type N-terminal cleavage/methylation domain-containing protein